MGRRHTSIKNPEPNGRFYVGFKNIALGAKNHFLAISVGRVAEDRWTEYCTVQCRGEHREVSAETRSKISVANSGRVATQEARDATSRRFKGKRKSPEQVEKRARKITQPDGAGAAHALYAGYRDKARKRNLEFSLDLTGFLELTKLPCYFCGDEPRRVKKSPHRYAEDYIYNGVDRLDSAVGYTATNTVACCWDCNRGKDVMGQDEFLTWVYRVYLLHTGELDKHTSTNTLSKDERRTVMSLTHRYSSRVPGKQINFALSQQEVEHLLKSNCAYCDSEPARVYKAYKEAYPIVHNGIDRIDSGLGYTMGNCSPCCWCCNHAKGDMSVVDFYRWIERVVAFNRDTEHDYRAAAMDEHYKSPLLRCNAYQGRSDDKSADAPFRVKPNAVRTDETRVKMRESGIKAWEKRRATKNPS